MVVRALRHRNYRLFFFGQGLSLVGSWMQWTAMGWLVYELTASKTLLGTVGFVSQIPAVFLASLAGVLADRWNRRRMVIATQTLAAVQAAALAALTLAGVVQIWHILALGVMIGVVNSFDVPARQSFVIDMLERRADLPNAIALNSFLFNSARLIGPMVAGAAIALMGEGLCFLANAVSFLAVIAALLAMRISSPPRQPSQRHVLREIKEGFRYVLGHASIRLVLLIIALVSLLGMPYSVLMPVFAKDILHGGPYTLGFLAAAPGIGALMGAVFLASRRNTVRMGLVIAIAAGIFGLGLIAFSLSRSLWLSMLILVPTGFGMLVLMAASNTVIQTLVDDDKRGRVMSFWMLAFMGMAPIGAQLAGFLADRVGAPKTVMLGGIVCLIAAVTVGVRLAVEQGRAPATPPAGEDALGPSADPPADGTAK
jgi:MFS family permease